jgi:hypothetical protein
MDLPDIYKNYSLLYHLSTNVTTKEILKYIKYYTEIKSWVMLDYPTYPCCHDVYINKEAAIIFKVTTIYFQNIKLILYQVIYQADCSINPEYLPSINYNQYKKLNSFFWSTIKNRNYNQLNRNLPINKTGYDIINKGDEYLLQLIMRKCEKSFQNIERAIFYPFLWTKDNKEINEFNEKLPLKKFQKYFIMS